MGLSAAMAAPAIEHTYRYRSHSQVRADGHGAHLELATSGGAAEAPSFFRGKLREPRLTTRLLRALAGVVGSRYHVPAAMLRRALLAADPVITSGGGLLRFEGFSACASVYARVDLTPDAYSGLVTGEGTTNVDFNAGMRAALAQVLDSESVSLAIGAGEVALERGSELVVERKVLLPLRWIRGFVEVQAYQARMERRFELGKVETLRFLRALPRSTASRSPCWVVPCGAGLRLTQQATQEGVKVSDLERLRPLEDLAPSAQGLRVHADPRGGASEWELLLGPLAFHLALSAEAWRGFSGEGQALSDLAAPCDEKLLRHVRGMLKWQSELHLEEFAANWEVPAAAIRRALAALGSRGLVGYDLARGAYFHRVLPFDLELVEEMHPRLEDARKLFAAGGMRLLGRTGSGIEVAVPGTGVVHRVRLTGEGGTCTCPWHARHQGGRGPCKHILAAQLLADSGAELPERGD
jgi:hypothetical protein